MTFLFVFVFGLSCLCLISTPAAWAGINDDRYEGNIFALYAGNGSLIPPKATLAGSLKQAKPALLVFYLNDSRDCKQYAFEVSKLQAFYGRAASFIPVNVDALSLTSTYQPTDPGYYYEGLVPQTVLLNQSGQVVLNAKGKVTFEEVDEVFREVFDLLPRSESVELRRRPVKAVDPGPTQSQHS